MSSDILIVDDNDDLRETLQMLLEQSGFSVSVAANGRMALEQLRAGARPGLIMLDLMMPDMNGWELLELVRRDGSLGSIPIVVMTAHKSPDLPLVAPEDLLHKPFDAAKVLAAVARHVRRKGT
jgi:CheY-like chemotaxis protein